MSLLALENTILFFHVTVPIQSQFSSNEQTELKKKKTENDGCIAVNPLFSCCLILFNWNHRLVILELVAAMISGGNAGCS